MKVWKPLGLAIAGSAIALSLINASWIAPTPKGQLVLVARRGLGPQPAGGEVRADGCAATRIAPPGDNFYIGNSLPSFFRAMRMGADAIEVDVRRTRDNQAVLFRDETLECRTNGRGAVGNHDLAALKALDIGFGYTADGGKTFPFRGRGIAGMPTVEEALRETPKLRFIFNLPGGDPADADALVAAFARAGREIDGKYSFRGNPKVVGRLKALVPSAWTWDAAAPQTCLADYSKIGWTSFVPESCRNVTIIIPVDQQWSIWGWPNRFQARMAGANSKVMVVEAVNGADVTGLTRVEQIDDVPRDFRGYLWIEDFATVGSAVRR
ncbi:MAG TPA: glycerophosphodiester phosphodiesterase family protein [Allosphingosinicella sp.]|jgi:glycerophosphoryl diester phosphodiesterase